VPRYKKFEKLLEPYHIGSVKTRNRMVRPGATTLFWHENELHMNNKVLVYHEAIAKGGIGLLMVEAVTIDYPQGTRFNRYRLDDDKYIQGLSELTEVIHKHGCPTFLSLWHTSPWEKEGWTFVSPGAWATESITPAAASPVSIKSVNDFHNVMPRELTIPEIEEIIDKFASAAVRAQKAGFDGVEINAASSHLLHNFLSSFWNRRQDAYGGSLENRARFLIEIIREIKKRLGQDFPISVIINFIEVGKIVGIEDNRFITPEQSIETARMLQEAGADALHVRNVWLGNHFTFLPDTLFYPEPIAPLKSFPAKFDWRRGGRGACAPMAAEIKKAVSIPIITVGGFEPAGCLPEADLGEKVLREGKADFIAINRGLMADPELPNKIAAGRLEDIVPCTRGHVCLFPGPTGTTRCRVNAAFGTGLPYEIEPAEKKKKVLVVGGGPAGMESARVAALRGHEVFLYDKGHMLGGLVPIASVVKGLQMEPLPAFIRYFKIQFKKLGVKVKLGQNVDAALIDKIKPDVVFVATGGKPVQLEIQGIKRRNVVDLLDMDWLLNTMIKFLGARFSRWLTKLYLPIGKRVVILGGAKHGCELAEFFTKRNRKVIMVDSGGEEALGEGIPFHLKNALFIWFEKNGVTVMHGVKYIEINDKGLVIINKEGDKQLLKADTIVPSLVLEPNLELFKALEGKVPEVYAIGDCREPNWIVDAVADGWRIARTL